MDRLEEAKQDWLENERDILIARLAIKNRWVLIGAAGLRIHDVLHDSLRMKPVIEETIVRLGGEVPKFDPCEEAKDVYTP